MAHGTDPSAHAQGGGRAGSRGRGTGKGEGEGWVGASGRRLHEFVEEIVLLEQQRRHVDDNNLALVHPYVWSARAE